MQIFTAEQTAAALPYPALIDALKAMFVQGCVVPRRHHHAIDSSDKGATLLIMPAWQRDRYLGIKHVTIYPENSQKHGLAGLFSTYTLFNAHNGVPLAVIDGNTITNRRTAAASVLAATFLARRDSHRLLIVGAGNVARELVPAYAAAFDLTRVQVWNKTHDKAVALATDLRAQGFNAEAVTDLAAAVADNDIISCATLSTEPLIHRDWVQAGSHVDLIGGFTPSMRESDDGLFADTSVFIDTDEALDKAGDLLFPMQAGILTREQVQADLITLCRQQHHGRTQADDITVYKAVGNAAEDLAAAILVYENANPTSK